MVGSCKFFNRDPDYQKLFALGTEASYGFIC